KGGLVPAFAPDAITQASKAGVQFPGPSPTSSLPRLDACGSLLSRHLLCCESRAAQSPFGPVAIQSWRVPVLPPSRSHRICTSLSLTSRSDNLPPRLPFLGTAVRRPGISAQLHRQLRWNRIESPCRK